MWKGAYKSWSDAISQCTGYDSDDVIEKTRKAMIKVRDGESAYERDTLLYDKIIYTWPLLATLLRAAIDNGNKLHVLDFGGSLGSSYYQNKSMLAGLDELTWNIIEQPRIVEIGDSEMADEHLRFYRDINECTGNININLVLVSGVLQYLENPHMIASDLVSTGAEYIYLDRTSYLRANEPDVLTIQYASPPYFTASFPTWFFNKQDLMRHFNKNYDLISEFNAYDHEDNKIYTFEGAIFKKKN